MLIRILDNVQNNLLMWIVSSLGLGLLTTKLFGGISFTPLICLLAALIMIYPSLVPLSFGRLKEAVGKYRIIIFSILLNFIASPAVAFFIGKIFLEDEPAVWVGLMILSLLPGGGMATTWALKSKSDMPTAIGIIFSNLVVAILAVPMLIPFFLEKISLIENRRTEELSCAVSKASSGMFSCSSGEIGPAKIAVAMAFIVVVPLVLAFLTQMIFRKKKGNEYFEMIKSNFGKFSNFGLAVMLFVLMSLKSNLVIFSNPEIILGSVFPVIIFYAAQLVFSFGAYNFLGKSAEGKSLVWGSYLRYVTLALGIVISLIYQNSAFALAIVPVILAYFVQIPSSFFISRYFEKTQNYTD